MQRKLTAVSRALRKRSTLAERILWSRIRTHRLKGMKFKRQQPMGCYVVDFVCFSAKLVVEVDGGQHADAKPQDRQRDQWLASQGFRVLRFWNNEVLTNLDGVMEVIYRSVGSDCEA